MSSQGGWGFRRRGFADVEQEVTEGDQFNTESVPDTEALVREATQNSQDARRAGSQAPVTLRFTLVGPEAGLDPAFLARITGGLKKHLAESGLSTSQELLESPRVLVIEDFGTEGLTGRIDDEKDEGNFRSFWFRHGRSFKSGSKNGRWGLGKLVYPMMSGTRCLFGLTIRHDDKTPLLLGEAVLKSHYIGGQRYAPHGHFGVHQNDDLRPITDPKVIEEFKRSLGLTRRDEPGLSVVVPYPRSEINRDKIIQFVVQNYAYPILTGRLVIEALGEIVDAKGVRRFGRQFLPQGLVEFIDTINNFERGRLVPVKARPRGSRSYLAEQDVEAEVPALRQRYAAGELIGFRVPLMMGRKNGAKPESEVAVFFQAVSDSPKGAAIYVRGDITVPDEAAQFKGQAVFAMLLAHDNTVSEFLADAENPAHTKWVATAARVKENWTYPSETLWQVRTAPLALHKILATGKERVDPTALKDFFWVEDPSRPPENGPKRGKRRNRKDGPEAHPPSPSPPVLPPTERKLLLRKREGGFSIRPGARFDSVGLPAVARIAIRYDVEFGTPKWDPLDFDLEGGEIAITTQGAELDVSGNVITLKIEDRDFELLVEGFDVRRDLMVDYNLLKTKEAADA